MKSINLILQTITMIMFGCFSVNGQGLNNHYPVDSVDIQKSLNLLGMHIFKFPIKSKEKAYLKIIREEYHDSSLISTDNNFKGLENIPKKYLASLIPVIDTSEEWIRLYWYDKNDTTVILQITYGDLNIAYDIKAKSHTFDYRAFDYKMPAAGERKELVVRYSQDGKGPIKHCPGGTPLKGIVKMYKDVIVVYLELAKIE